MEALRTLLIIDGHTGVREALAHRLQHASGISTVVAVGDAETGTRLVRKLAPDVVIYDPKTVAGDRQEALGSLVSTGHPVVVLTSSLLDGEAENLTRAGAAAVLVKGQGVLELLTRVEAAIARHRAARHAYPA